jgi:hypothetical protein
MHAFIRFKCSAIGLEVEKYRWFMSWLMISNSISKEFRNWGLEECKKKLFMLHADLSDRRIKNYDGITHFITFDVGMPPWVKDHIHKCLKRTERRIYLVCFTPETVLKRDYGYLDNDFLFKIPVRMTGGEGKTAIGVRINSIPEKQKRIRRSKIGVLGTDKYDCSKLRVPRPVDYEMQVSPGPDVSEDV